MARWSLTSLLAACALGAPLVAPAAAQTPFARVFPASSVATLVVDDVPALREQLARSSWGRVLADPGAALLAQALADGVADLSARGSDAWGSDPVALLDMLGGQVGVALLELSTSQDERDSSRGEPQGALAVLAELGEQAETFGQALDALMTRWTTDAGMLLEQQELGGRPAAVVRSPDGRKGELHYLLHGSVLVLVLNSERVDGVAHAERLVSALDGAAGDALSEASTYGASVASREVSADPGLRVFADASLVLELVTAALTSPDDDQQDADAADAAEDAGRELVAGLHLDALRSLSVSAWFDQGPLRSEGRLDVAQPLGLWSLPAAAVDRQRCDLLRLAPADAVHALAADVDVGAAFDAALELMAAVDPEAGFELLADMAQVENEQGFHPKDDLIDGFGGQFLMFVAEVEPEQGLPLPGEVPVNYGLAASLVDGEATTQLLDDLVRKHGLHAARTRADVEGDDLYVIPLGPVLSLAYAVRDDLLVVSASPGLVQDMLRRERDPTLPCLASAPDFLAAREQLPEDETCVSYARAGDAMRDAFERMHGVQRTGRVSLHPLAPPMTVAIGSLGILASLPMPQPELVAEHVQGAEVAVWLVSETGGVSVSQVAP